MFKMAMWKQQDNVKVVACNDKPTDDYLSHLELPSALQNNTANSSFKF